MPVFKAEAAPEAYVTEDGAIKGYWLIRTWADDRWHATQAKKHVEVHGMAADWFACYLDLPVDDIAIQVKFYETMPPDWFE
jgi:hypothetical protein